MPHHHHSHFHRSLHLENRAPEARPLPVPIDRLDHIFPRNDPSPVLKRAAATTSTSIVATVSCGPHNNSPACEKPADSGNGIALPVTLGSVIPITVAIIVLFFLHRRHVKKLRLEDKNDKHKSLDFGMDDVDQSAGRKKNTRKISPEMSLTDAEKTLRRDRGLSLDVGNNPYLLPPGLHNSRESLHSLARTGPTDDRYRPATNYIPNDETRSYSPSMRRALDDSSSYTGSSRRGMGQDDMGKNLLKNAQRMSRSTPPTLEISPPSGSDASFIPEPAQAHIVSREEAPLRPNRGAISPSPTPSQRSDNKDESAIRVSNMYLGKFIHTRDPSADLLSQNKEEQKIEPPAPKLEKNLPDPGRHSPPAPKNALPANPRPPRLQSIDAPGLVLPPLQDLQSAQENNFSSPGNDTISEKQQYHGQGTEYQHQEQDNGYPSYDLGPEHQQHEQDQSYRSYQAEPEHQYQEQNHGYNSHQAEYEPPIAGRYSVDAQAFPANDEHSDHGYDEQEYMGDPRRRTLGFRPLPPEDPNDTPEQRATRIKSFYKEYFDESRQTRHYPPPPQPGQHAMYYEDYDSYSQEYHYDSGAMYDDENGQFVTGQNHFYEEPITRRAMTPPPRGPPRFRGPPRHMSGGSQGGYMPGPRSYSSASYQYGGAGRGPSKKPMPPPTPLRSLPTPHLLKDDTFIPIDFAPPSSVKDRVMGRPESPLGISKPYSPSVPAFNPMASSFDDLSMMPSPHALRKSGTFTALDFAPPPRFKNSDAGSDAGSMRSGRSGMSASQLNNIRAGAYRISRIPKGVAGTKNELAQSLRPKWDMSG